MLDRKPHPHVEMLRAIYADLRLLTKFASEDIVLHAAGPRDITPAGSRGIMGDYIGKRAVLARATELFRRSGGSLVMTVDDVVANDYFGAALGRLTANRNGRQFEGEFCGLWRFQDGRIVEHWENAADWPAAKRFFLDEFDDEAIGEPIGEPIGTRYSRK
jgi:ketosteroid isomerase-like protein